MNRDFHRSTYFHASGHARLKMHALLSVYARVPQRRWEERNIMDMLDLSMHAWERGVIAVVDDDGSTDRTKRTGQQTTRS